MLEFQAEHIAGPTLAVDLGPERMRGLLCLPGPSGGPSGPELFHFVLPSPEGLQAARIRAALGAGRALHLHGRGGGTAVGKAIVRGLAAGADLTLHPETAGTLSAQPGRLERAGAALADAPPPDCESIALRDWDPDCWPAVLGLCGLPVDPRLLLAAPDSGYPLDLADGAADGPTYGMPHAMTDSAAGERNAEAEDAPRARRMTRLFAGDGGCGLPLERLVNAPPDPLQLRLSAIQRITGASVTDSGTVWIPGLCSLPDIAGRSFRQGVTLLRAGSAHVQAALLFRKRLYAFLELPLERVMPCAGRGRGRVADALLPLLDDLRLGWLPPERARQFGGYLCRSPEMPPDAEGFGPIFAIGENASALAGRARVVDACADASLLHCRGLVYACGLSLSGN